MKKSYLIPCIKNTNVQVINAVIQHIKQKGNNKKIMNFDVLLKLCEKYRDDAEKCLEVGAIFAGLVSARAALETAISLKLHIGILDLDDKQCSDLGIQKINDDEIILSEFVRLSDLIKIFEENSDEYKAAKRIVEDGNKIHCLRISENKDLESINKELLKQRLHDLDLIFKFLVDTL
jgi:hypothetical protein